MDRNSLTMAIALLDELVNNGQVPRKGAVFGDVMSGFLDYEGVRKHIQMGTIVGYEAAEKLINGVFGEDNMMTKPLRPQSNSGLILP